ncbi:MAG: adenine phosphoribosyltransferase [Bacteroidia bacterium]|nr:adenine phosphoribosyltransferase [Bacteroidia bacterium]
MQLEAAIKEHIREVPDFPIKGVLFKDISPLFLNPGLINSCTEALTQPWKGIGVNKVIGIDSRGFLLGPQIAAGLDAGFVMIRKKGKLPPQTVSVAYSLEYGEAELESTSASIVPGDKVIVHDDLLATGGTAAAAAELVHKLGGEVVGFSFLIYLDFLGGEAKLHQYSDSLHYLVSYNS